MIEVLNALTEILDKNEAFKFKDFLNRYNDIKSWYLMSDYCLEDTQKYNDVFSFTLLLNIDEIKNLKDYIKLHAPTDLKKTKNITEGIIEFINSSAVYHFSIIIPRSEKLLSGLCDKARFTALLTWMTDIVENSKTVHPQRSDFFNDMLKRLKLIKTEMLKTSFNEKLMRKIFISGFLGAQIIRMLRKHSDPTHIAWISDRDAIVDTYDGFAFDNMYFWYEILAINEKFPFSDLQIYYIEPEKVGKNFYDELIRIPDFIAGTLASIDCTSTVNFDDLQDKHKIILHQAFTNSANQATIRIQRTDSHLSAYNFKWIAKK